MGGTVVAPIIERWECEEPLAGAFGRSRLLRECRVGGPEELISVLYEVQK